MEEAQLQGDVQWNIALWSWYIRWRCGFSWYLCVKRCLNNDATHFFLSPRERFFFPFEVQPLSVQEFAGFSASVGGLSLLPEAEWDLPLFECGPYTLFLLSGVYIFFWCFVSCCGGALMEGFFGCVFWYALCMYVFLCSGCRLEASRSHSLLVSLFPVKGSFRGRASNDASLPSQPVPSNPSLKHSSTSRRRLSGLSLLLWRFICFPSSTYGCMQWFWVFPSVLLPRCGGPFERSWVFLYFSLLYDGLKRLPSGAILACMGSAFLGCRRFQGRSCNDALRQPNLDWVTCNGYRILTIGFSSGFICRCMALVLVCLIYGLYLSSSLEYFLLIKFIFLRKKKCLIHTIPFVICKALGVGYRWRYFNGLAFLHGLSF